MVQLAQFPGVDLLTGASRQIESLESKILGIGSIECELRSYHAPGVWIRELRVPALDPWGTLVIGHEHRHANLNIMAAGEKLLLMEDRVERMVAPYCILSSAGVRKVGLILEDMVWFSVHANPTNERDEDKLEEMFYVKSATFKENEVRRAELRFKQLESVIVGRTRLKRS